MGETVGLEGATSIAGAPPAAEPPTIGDGDRHRLLEIVLGDCGSRVTWRRARILVLSAQQMPPEQIGEIVAADPDTVRQAIDDFHRHGFDSLSPHANDRDPPSPTLAPSGSAA